MRYTNILLLIILTVIISCEGIYTDPVRLFTIKKGEHYSTHAIEMLDSRQMNFRAMFDSTAIYDLDSEAKQSSTNKLLGFADCNSHHHENSARFGWQWYHDQLEILAYTYVDGERQEEFIGVVTLDKYHFFSIALEDDHYAFRLDNLPVTRMTRGQTCNTGAYYMLFPYFGGQDVAPHDIHIYIKFDN